MNDRSNFYDSGGGDRLIDPSRYPDEIVDYLSAEVNLLSSTSSHFDTLIEVGCMEGRYLDWAVAEKKNYLGIDVVEKYIRNGQKRLLSAGLDQKQYRIEVGDAISIHRFPHENKWLRGKSRIFAIFPFNSFGNMHNPDAVLDSLSKAQYPFLICSYSTDNFANQVRLRYYKNCGYEQIKLLASETGIRFTSVDGLNTVAYHPSYLKQLARKNGIVLTATSFSSIGMAYRGV